MLVIAEPLIFLAAVLGCVIVVLSLPLATPWIGVAAVVAAIAAVCVLLVAVTIWTVAVGTRAQARRHDLP
ncbi:hypothetical protein [Nonomuraea sp. NPDC003201]